VATAINQLLRSTWIELHKKLSPALCASQPGLREKLAQCQVPPAPDVAALLDLVGKNTPRSWAAACKADFWVSAHAYHCETNYATGRVNELLLGDGVADAEGQKVLSAAAAALRQAALGEEHVVVPLTIQIQVQGAVRVGWEGTYGH
jgi:hypothetical protein